MFLTSKNLFANILFLSFCLKAFYYMDDLIKPEFFKRQINVTFKIISHGSQEYIKAIKLRQSILKKTDVEQNLAEFENEQNYIHIVGIINENIIATACLIQEAKALKISNIAIDETLQGKGIGSKLIAFCEKYARENGYIKIYCHARENVINFFKKNGYESYGFLVEEQGIPHFIKQKFLYTIRKGTIADHEKLKSLYLQVAKTPDRLIRTAEEITDSYINEILTNALSKGLIIVAEYNNRLIGSMLKYRPEPKAFSHILNQGSILVDPNFQGHGIGTKLITSFQNEISTNRPDILRIELIVRESNPALKLYERLGFIKEGKFTSRVISSSGNFDSDIPMVWLNPNFRYP